MTEEPKRPVQQDQEPEKPPKKKPDPNIPPPEFDRVKEGLDRPPIESRNDSDQKEE